MAKPKLKAEIKPDIDGSSKELAKLIKENIARASKDVQGGPAKAGHEKMSIVPNNVPSIDGAMKNAQARNTEPSEEPRKSAVPKFNATEAILNNSDQRASPELREAFGRTKTPDGVTDQPPPPTASDRSEHQPPAPKGLVQQGGGVYDKEGGRPHRSSPQTAAEKEANASTADGQKSKQLNDENRLGPNKPDEESSSNKGGKKRAKGNISRSKKIIISLIVATLGVGGIGITTLSGPFKLIHFAQILQTHFRSHEFFTDDRTSRLTTFRRYVEGNGSVQNTRLDKIAGKYADRWDRRLDQRSGIRPVYDKSTGRMVGFQITDEEKAADIVKRFESEGVNIVDHDDYISVGRLGDGEVEGRIIDLRGSRAATRRSAIRTVVEGLDLNRVSSAVGSRVLIKLGGVEFHPIKNIKRAAGEKFIDFYRRKQEQHRERIKLGADGPNTNRLGGDDRVDGEGKSIGNPEAKNIAEDAGTELNEAIRAGKSGRLSEFKNRFATKLTGGLAAGAAAAVGAICLVNDLGNQAEEMRYANTILPMMRLGFEYISIGSQIIALQGLNFDELNYYISRLYDTERNMPHVAAASIQFENGLEPSGPDINPGVKPDEDNGKPLLFRAINAIPGIDTGCFIAGGGWIQKIPIVGNIYESVTAFANNAVNKVLEETIGITIDDVIEGVVGWLAGEAVDTLATGANLGNYANYGARLAANTQSLASGGRELNGVETAQLRDQEETFIAEDRKNMSIAERYFSIDTPGSLTQFAIASIGGGTKNLAFSLIQNPFSSINAFLPQASAQTITYDYGFSKVSFSVDEASSTIIEDPYLNAEDAESRFDDLNDKYGKCFPTKLLVANGETILNVGSYTDPELVNQFNNDNICNNPDDEDLLRFRAYLSDTMVTKSLNCYEGDSSACSEIGFNSAIGGGGEQFNGQIDDRMADTTTLTCAPKGLQGERNNIDIFGPNNIKLCNYGSNVWVNASWSPAVSEMLADAKAAGIDVSGGAWRSHQDQITLYNRNCGGGTRRCDPPTARPGSSNHEYGLAIDFGHITRTCGARRGVTTCTRSATYNWLVANAGRYGIRKLNSEAWHWSYNGN